MSVPYIISAIMTPFFGLLIDKIGKRGLFLILSSLIMIFAHLMMIIMP
jgi:hypothetical protein